MSFMRHEGMDAKTASPLAEKLLPRAEALILFAALAADPRTSSYHPKLEEMEGPDGSDRAFVTLRVPKGTTIPPTVLNEIARGALGDDAPKDVVQTVSLPTRGDRGR